VKVTLVRTPAGNFGRLRRGLERAGARVEVGTPGELDGSERAVVLAGVSAFGTIARSLGRARERIGAASRSGVPILGVCAGFQVLYESSEEGPGRGLALLPGRVRELRTPRVPHLGWSPLSPARPRTRILEGLPEGSYAYFAHSFRAPPSGVAVAARTTYQGETYPSAVERGNLWGVQFHPEISGSVGARVLANFVAFAEEAAP
jgi:imidazole glycerol-phosphate synthase subunit HisH